MTPVYLVKAIQPARGQMIDRIMSALYLSSYFYTYCPSSIHELGIASSFTYKPQAFLRNLLGSIMGYFLRPLHKEPKQLSSTTEKSTIVLQSGASITTIRYCLFKLPSHLQDPQQGHRVGTPSRVSEIYTRKRASSSRLRTQNPNTIRTTQHTNSPHT